MLLDTEPSESVPSSTFVPEPEPARRGEQRSVYVLVVDDEPVVRGLIARVLEERGYMVQVAGNGAEALKIALADPTGFDFLITDIRMPVMDGWELGRQIRERWPDLPILYISGYDIELAVRRRGTSRTSGFLQKPFDPGELLARMTELLESP
jgi:two-component system cell cycle sensor histidine kinase/response regulator CckA